MCGFDRSRSFSMPNSRTEDLSGRRAVVTGGAGFLGSNIVDRLLELGAQVVLFDDFSTGSERVVPQDETLEIVRGSVSDYDLVRSALQDATVVFHEAARNIIQSMRDPHDDFEVNIGGTLNVLLAARDCGVDRVVYASSASIYGNPRYLPINEDDLTNALTPYSVSKFAGESYCKAFYESYDLPTTVVRYSNVYGPGQSADNPYCGVIAKFFESVMSGEPPKIHGDGEQTRDFTYIDDAVDATILAACTPRAEGQVYNIGTGRETTINELARMVVYVTGADVEPEHIDRRDIDNIRRRVLNIEKSRRELRWIPSFTLEQGLRHTYDWSVSQLKSLSRT
jgi:UDP-glucose 4-epimerase